MSKEFNCEAFEDLTFEVNGIMFPYRECEVLAERVSKALSVIDLVLKNGSGQFAEIIVRSADSGLGKANIKRGTYTIALRSASEAEEQCAITSAFQ